MPTWSRLYVLAALRDGSRLTWELKFVSWEAVGLFCEACKLNEPNIIYMTVTVD